MDSFLTDSEIREMVDTVNQLANCTLLTLESAGAVADNGDASGEPVPFWEGEALCSLYRSVRFVGRMKRELPEPKTFLRVFDAADPDGVSPDEIAGLAAKATTLTLIDNTGSAPKTTRWTVIGKQRVKENALDYVKLELEDEQPA